MSKRHLVIVYLILGGLLLLLFALTNVLAQDTALTPIEELGKALYFDTNLSVERNQSCASCHDPATGFTGPNQDVNVGSAVYPGSIRTRAGNRKPPTVAYAGESPVLSYDHEEDVWTGGMFWDGRATGETLGDPLAEQAQGPFLNPLEQALLDAQHLCLRVSEGPYTAQFEAVWGAGSLDCENNVDGVYEAIGRSISAFEQSTEVNPFTSKYDYYLAGEVELTEEEALGLELFEGRALCAQCHPSQPGPNGEPPLFTDFTYDNLGMPVNPRNPFYQEAEFNPDTEEWVDLGLGGYLQNAGYPAHEYIEQLGKQKVPTLRNVDLRPSEDFIKAYGHNGYFLSLEDVVHFYNTRDVEEWPESEVEVNVNHDELGNLGLTPAEEAALVAFMRTLSDGYQP